MRLDKNSCLCNYGKDREGNHKLKIFGVDRVSKLKEFLLANPTDSFLLHALALEYIKLGDDEQAKNLFEEVINREPGYIGTYYHLAKLLERLGETDKAIQVYKKGMEEARNAGDNHALGELRGAYEELTF